MFKRIVFVVSGLAAVAVQAYTYDVASGATTTVSDKLTGAEEVVKTGAGTLELTNGENDYSLGTGVTGGVLRVTAVGALGTGTVTVDGTDQKVELSAPKAASGYNVYANPFVFTGTGNALGGSGNTDSKWSLWFGPDKDTKLKLTGGITARRGLRMRTFTTSTSPTSCQGPEVVLDCAVNAAGQNVYVESYGTVSFTGKVSAALMYLGDAHSTGGKVYLASPENEVDVWRLGNEIVYCNAENTLGGGELEWFACGTGVDAGHALVDMQGLDQTVTSLSSPTPTSVDWSKPYAYSGNKLCVKSSKSSKSATLTLTGRSTDAQTYTTVRDYVSLVIDAESYPTFQQSFMRHPSTMTGIITVKKGKMRLAEAATFANATGLVVNAAGTFKCESTSATAALAAVKTLKVAGIFDASSATVNPFTGELDLVELADGAVLKLPQGSTIKAKSMKVGDRTYAAGVVTALAGITLENVTIVATGAPTACTWTDGAGDGLLSTLGNWQGDVEFAVGSVKPTFATAGTSATVDTDASFCGIVFDSPNDFTLARLAENPKTLLVAGDITVATNETDGVVRNYTIDNPLKLVGDCKVTFGGKSQLYFKNALAADDAAGGVITVKGTSMVFEGMNTLAGGIRIGAKRLSVKQGTLATPGHVRGARPASDTPSGNEIYINLHDGYLAGNQNCGLQLQNAVVEKALLVNNCIGSCSVYAPEGTTNEIRGYVRFLDYSHECFSLYPNSETTLSGGLETIHSFRVYNGGTLRIKDTPALFLGSAGLNPDYGTVVLEVANNTVTNLCVGYNGNRTVKIVTTVDYALTNGHFQVGGNGGSFESAAALSSGTYTLDLKGTKQRCQCLGVMKRGVLTGEYPAMLEVSEGRHATGSFAKFGYSVVGQVTGGVGLHMMGLADGVLLCTNRAFTSCGDLKVTSGTLEFAEATWLNGTNVTVAGTGTLKLTKLDSKGAVFDGRHAQLHLGADADGWTIDLPAGKEQRFAWGYDANGVPLPSGVYGNSAVQGVTQTRYSGHFPATGGVIRITRHGTSVILR